MNSWGKWPKDPFIKYTELNTWTNKYIIRDAENTSDNKNGWRVFGGNTTYACPLPLASHPPEVIISSQEMELLASA